MSEQKRGKPKGTGNNGPGLKDRGGISGGPGPVPPSSI
jgi:hypothetical protein